jgi:hypothetical protein
MWKFLTIRHNRVPVFTIDLDTDAFLNNQTGERGVLHCAAGGRIAEARLLKEESGTWADFIPLHRSRKDQMNFQVLHIGTTVHVIYTHPGPAKRTQHFRFTTEEPVSGKKRSAQ